MHLRCGDQLPLFAGITEALIISLGTCIVRLQSVWEKFARTKRLFNLSAEAIKNVRNARLCARCAAFFLKINKFPISLLLAQRAKIKRVQVQFRMLLEKTFVLRSTLPTDRNANLLTVM